MSFYKGENIILETTLVSVMSLVSGFGIGVFYIYSFVEILDRCPGKDSEFYSSAMICMACLGNLCAPVVTDSYTCIKDFSILLSLELWLTQRRS